MLLEEFKYWIEEFTNCKIDDGDIAVYDNVFNILVHEICAHYDLRYLLDTNNIVVEYTFYVPTCFSLDYTNEFETFIRKSKLKRLLCY